MNLRMGLVLCGLIFACSADIVAQQSAEAPDIPLKLQVNVNKVLVSVVVRDKQGNIVGDLKQQDFQVFDNDKPHPVSGLMVERRVATAGGTQQSAASDQAPATGANASAATAPTQRFVVFVFDDLHLSAEDLAQAKSAAAKVLAEALTGRDIGAVISLSQKTNSGLTRDHARLLEAMMSLQSRNLSKSDNADCPNVGYYQADLMENKHDSNAIQDAVRKVFNCNPSLDPVHQLNVAENEADSTARRVLALGHQDVQTTYATISAFVRTMATLPGERVMILVSPGFLRIEQDTLNMESRLMDLAAESDVTISTLDARGLYTSQITASQASPGQGRALVENSDYVRSADKLAEEPMAELADATGGTFFVNSNDLSEGFKRLTDAPEVVYVLELSTDGVRADGSYHSLKVKVDRDGVDVKARKGYFIPKPEKNKK